MSLHVTVEIPEGEHCREAVKPCVFAKYTRKFNAYNCSLHNKLLKGGQDPKKCEECRRLNAAEEERNGA